MTMLYQCFGRDRRTGEYTKEPVYINATSVDHAFDQLMKCLDMLFNGSLFSLRAIGSIATQA